MTQAINPARTTFDGKLTQDEVDALPDGTQVEIIWSGGNGPHKYLIQKRNGRTCATTQRDPAVKHSIDFVGNERFHTWVRLA